MAGTARRGGLLCHSPATAELSKFKLLAGAKLRSYMMKIYDEKFLHYNKKKKFIYDLLNKKI